ncbi:Soluble lytic murein transglycosylase precursor [hydrothermal vent metagenome]|uniref:Soluble lytic murein transglycosylase n=1 Tax=hydrothermal vent metagenome TaxID=652676 RepID=A0A3B1CGZ4_9ZZZZ
MNFKNSFSKIFCALAVIPCLVQAPSATADIYAVKNKNGTLLFTDIEPSPKDARGVVRQYNFGGTGNKGATTRRFIQPASGRYDSLIRNAALQYGLDPMLVKSVIKIESGFQRFAISPKGAKGLMQLMPQTAKEMKVKNIFDAAQNINGGSRYLKLMLDKFGSTRLALAAYNAGPTAVKKHKGVPPYPETKNYVKKVFAAYKRLTGRPKVQTVAQNGKTQDLVVHVYESNDGNNYYTDSPVGKLKIIRY